MIVINFASIAAESSCPPNMDFRTGVPGCLPTCSEPGADMDCFEQNAAMCVCTDQWDVYVDETVGCMTAWNCGCEDDYGVHEVGVLFSSMEHHVRILYLPCLSRVIFCLNNSTRVNVDFIPHARVPN